MKKYCFTLICIALIQVLLSGCTKNGENPSKVIKSGFKLEPSKIEHSFDGFEAELDGENMVIYNQGSLKIIDLRSSKILSEVPVSKECGVLGFDIYGDIITWAEVDPKSIKNSQMRDVEKEVSNIYIYNFKTNTKRQVTIGEYAKINPKIWKSYLIWQDNRDDKVKDHPGKWSLYLFDLDKGGKEKKITSTLAAHATYNICDNRMVWEDERDFSGSDIVRGGDNVPENNKDIYMYDIIAGTESKIATGPYMECKPDVNGNYIVWEDRNNNTLYADIVLYNIDSKEKTYITKDKVDQGTPRIFGDYIVWMDERRGTSTNDIIVNGKMPNSDILIYNVKTKTGRIMTGDEPQILPKISSEFVAFTLSRQVEPKVQVVKYK